LLTASKDASLIAIAGSVGSHVAAIEAVDNDPIDIIMTSLAFAFAFNCAQSFNK